MLGYYVEYTEYTRREGVRKLHNVKLHINI